MSTQREPVGSDMIWHFADVGLAVAVIALSTGAILFFRAESAARDAGPREALSRWEEQVEPLRAQHADLSAELRRLPGLEDLPDADLEAIRAARRRLQQQLAALSDELARLREQLEAARQRGELAEEEHQRLNEELQRLQEQIQQLKAQLEQAEYDRQRIEQLSHRFEQLLRELEAARQQYHELQEQIAAARSKLVEQGLRVEVHPRFFQRAGLKPQFVVIRNATVTPARAPYYQTHSLPGVSATEYRFQRRGPSAAEALRPGSEFIRWLDDLDPERQFVFLLVDSGSFETFRGVRAELHARGIPCGWEPQETVSDFTAGSGISGDRVGPQG